MTKEDEVDKAIKLILETLEVNGIRPNEGISALVVVLICATIESTDEGFQKMLKDILRLREEYRETAKELMDRLK